MDAKGAETSGKSSVEMKKVRVSRFVPIIGRNYGLSAADPVGDRAVEAKPFQPRDIPQDCPRDYQVSGEGEVWTRIRYVQQNTPTHFMIAIICMCEAQLTSAELETAGSSTGEATRRLTEQKNKLETEVKSLKQELQRKASEEARVKAASAKVAVESGIVSLLTRDKVDLSLQPATVI